MTKTIMIINHVQVTSHYRHWQRQTDGSIVTTFWWLAGCTTHHISGSATLRRGSQGGKIVDARGLHGLACWRSASIQQRHYLLNDIIWRDLKRAQIHAVKEPEAHVANSSRQAGAAANLAANNKATKYDHLIRTHCVLARCHCNGGYLALTGDWTGRKDWKTHHHHYWRFKRDGISVSATVRGTSKGKRGFFSKYLRCQPVRCNPLYSLLLSLCAYLAVCRVG